MKVNADFGGISYTTGDFHTPGTSGLGEVGEISPADFGSMGFALNDVFKTVFGKDAEAVKANLQAGASTLATNVVGTKLATDAQAKQGIVDTVKESAAQIYEEYKWPIIIGTSFVGIVTVVGLYNLFKKR